MPAEGWKLVEQVMGGGTAGIIMAATLVALHFWSKRQNGKNGGPLTSEVIMAIAKQVGDVNREAMRESIGKVHAHLERHEKEEMIVFRQIVAQMTEQTAAWRVAREKLETIDRRSLAAEIREEERAKLRSEGGL